MNIAWLIQMLLGCLVIAIAFSLVPIPTPTAMMLAGISGAVWTKFLLGRLRA